MYYLPLFFGKYWFLIIIILTIGGCVIKSSDIKTKMGGIVLIVLILFMNWYLQ